MADKQLGITVTGDIDDILSKLDDVIGKIQDVPDRTVELGLNINDNGLDTLKTDLDGISDKSIAVNVDDSGITQLTSTADEAYAHIEAIGDASANVSTDITGNFGDQSIANNSILSLGTSAKETTSDISDTGQAGEDSANQISDNMNTAVLAVAAVAAAAELSAEKLYDMGQASLQLATYTGMSDDEIKSMETSLSRASFPIESVDSYLETLMQLDVPNSLLKDNASALNEIVLGTGSAASEGTAFAKSIKVLGGDVSNLTDYYGMAAYAQKNVVGGLEAFDTIAKTLGPKLKEMGLTTEQSAVVIASLSQKYGGNVRMMRKAITDANGDVGKLYSTLGLTADQVNDTTETFGSYSDKLVETAEASKKAHTATEEAQVQMGDWGLYAGKALPDILSLITVIGGSWGIVGVLAKAKDLLYDTSTATKWWKETTKNAFSSVGNFFKSSGNYIWETIKSWTGWSDDAKKATDSVINDITKASPEAEQAGVKLGNALGEGVSKGIKSSAVLLDESGNILWTDTEGIIKNIGTKGSNLAETTGSKITSSFGRSFLTGATRAVGDVAAGATLLIDGLANYTEYLKDPIGTLLGPVKYLIPPQIVALNNLASPEKILTALVGPNNAQEFMNWAKIKIEDPMRNAIGDTFGDVTSWWNGLVGKVGLDTLQVANTTSDGVTVATNKAASVAESAAAKMKITTVNSYAAQMAAAQQYAQAAIDAYDKATAAAEASWSRMSSMLSSMGISMPESSYSTSELLSQRNDALKDLRAQRNALTQAGVGAFGGDLKAYKNAIADIDKQIKQLSSSSVFSSIASSGQSIGATWGNSVASGISSSQTNINNAIANASKGLIAHSPPKEGPLSKIDQYGYSIGQTFTEYLSKGLTSVSDVLGMGSMSLTTPLPSAASISNMTNSAPIYVEFTGPITIPEGSDPKVVGERFVEGAVPTLATKLGRQASNMGINPINDRR